MCSSQAADKWALSHPIEHQGMCDASAAIPIGTNQFLVASDEDNILRLYDSDRSGPPLQAFDLNSFLGTTTSFPEVDIEGCARIADRVYWIGSHGRSRDGEPRPNRHRFFATEIKSDPNGVALAPVGEPCRNLMDQLARDPQYTSLGLRQASTKAPKQELGLNIEGLAAMPDGALLIAFRNPIPREKALLAPLLNPADVVQGRPAKFAPPIFLNLDKLGVRDIIYGDELYFIIGGPFDGGGPFRFYLWSGPGHQPQRLKVERLGNYHPEVAISYPHLGLRQIQLLSDDGTRLLNGRPCKELKGLGRFRSVWMISGK